MRATIIADVGDPSWRFWRLSFLMLETQVEIIETQVVDTGHHSGKSMAVGLNIMSHDSSEGDSCVKVTKPHF